MIWLALGLLGGILGWGIARVWYDVLWNDWDKD